MMYIEVYILEVHNLCFDFGIVAQFQENLWCNNFELFMCFVLPCCSVGQ